MQNAENVLKAMWKLGSDGQPLARVYRQLFNEKLYLAAYVKLSKNEGALTKGTLEDDTIDGMSMDRINRVIEQMRYERFRFTPSRREWIEKKNSSKKRPIGIPNFTDKLVYEVIRGLLEAYYEPQFSDNSHGFRPERGCHTALSQIREQFKGIVWYIEGDIKGCFDNINQEVMMEILSRNIHDNRLLNLIRQGLKAGVMDDWRYEETYSGTPQGGVLSPLLANIYLNELDQFIAREIKPKWTKGEKRQRNSEYRKYEHLIRKARIAQDKEEVKRLQQIQRQIPAHVVDDPNFRRIKYVRYADDFILGFIGTRAEAQEIKEAIGAFLGDVLKLKMSDQKTLITHARTQKATFLGYQISTHHSNEKIHQVTREDGITYRKRAVNGSTKLGVPFGLTKEKAKRYMKRGKPIHRVELLHNSVAEIIEQYQTEYRGLVEYYKYAEDVHQLNSLKYVMEQSLTKTMAHKLKMSVSKVYRKYSTTMEVNGTTYKVLQETLETPKGPRTFTWGGIPLKRHRGKIDQPLRDKIRTFKWSDKSDLTTRLLRGECEVCGSTVDLEVHHIKRLRDLKKRWQGRKEKPEWVKRMIALHRKTLVVCKKCHQSITAFDKRQVRRQKLTGEPSAVKVASSVRRGVQRKSASITSRNPEKGKKVQREGNTDPHQK